MSSKKPARFLAPLFFVIPSLNLPSFVCLRNAARFLRRGRKGEGPWRTEEGQERREALSQPAKPTYLRLAGMLVSFKSVSFVIYYFCLN